MPTSNLDAQLDLAERLVEATRPIITGYFRQAVDIDQKADATPVTIADRAAEAEMRRLIAATFPAHGIVGEEEGAVRPGAEYVWVLDPIDGTKRFITGNPCFGTLVALLRDGRPLLGVIDMPLLAERWIGAEGRATLFVDRLGRRPARTRTCPDIAEASLYSTSPHMFEGPDAPAFARVRDAAGLVLYGSECYGYGLLASGHSDLVIEADMAPYDYLAQVPIITGAGGVMSDWQGGALGLNSGHRVLAAGDPHCHARAVALLAAA